MSVEFGIYVVDWESFTVSLESAGDPFEVVEELTQERLSVDSLEAQDEFLGCLDKLRERMAPDAWNAMSELFGHLFWSWQGADKQILDCGEPDTGIDVAWAPDTVKRFAALLPRMDLATSRSAFEAVKPPSGWFPGADGFISFAGECGDCVERAAKEGKGLVVFVFG